MKNFNIEKVLCRDANILQIENGCATAKILDAELDILNCSFNNDLCVEINTEQYTYITLTLENIKILKKLIIQAEEFYK